jgi:PQQ-dependent catabolism-associated CXXCW motif protein
VLRAALLLACLLPGVALAQAVAEPEGFRGAPYAAPVPEGLTGATTVRLEEAHRLWEEGEVAFIDVLPRDPKPADLPEGTIWRERPHDSIPGATWLPNTGYEALAPEEQAYLEGGLRAATEGDLARPVLFFCKTDCWMSWNAAKRALELGYTNVTWFPEGADGWAGAGFPTERVQPLVLP